MLSARQRSVLADVLAGLRAEIDSYATAHPGANIEISWRVVPDGSGGSDREGTGG